MKRILFIAGHRKDRAPNQRFRFEQYFSFLEQHGFECILSPLIATPEEDKVFYNGPVGRKLALASTLAARRLKDVWRANEFDVIIIAREAFVTGTTFFERSFKRSKAKIIFDFDDSIWINVISKNNKALAWLKDGNKTSKIISLADKVFAGNAYLASYAKQFNDQVVIIPTTIDTELYAPHYSSNPEVVTLGWSGSISTIEHFKYAIPALTILKEKYKNRIRINVIGDANYHHKELDIEGVAWSAKTELKDLQQIDIGLMPLPDDEWTKGKCGLKGLQYMALEIPTVMSPVGVNTNIITDGINGFLAGTTDEWVGKISQLIESSSLRLTIGKQGRKTVLDKYSVVSQRENYLNQINSLL